MSERLSGVKNFLTERRFGRERPPRKTTMGFTGDPEVIQNLFRKKQLLEQGDPRHEDIKILIIWGPGGQKAATEAGISKVLKETGLLPAVTTHLGISGGAGPLTAIYFDSIDAWESIFPEENVRNKLFGLRRPGKLLDLDGLEQTFRTKSPDTFDHLKDQEPDFLVAVTDEDTGNAVKLNLKHLEDPIHGTIASMNMPLANSEPTEINGRRYRDGCLACPTGISWGLYNKDFRPTDILYISAEPLDQHSEFYYALGLLWENIGKTNNELSRLLKWMTMKTEQELRFIPGVSGSHPAIDREGNLVRVASIHPRETPLKVWTMDSALIRQAMQDAEIYAHQLFAALAPSIT